MAFQRRLGPIQVTLTELYTDPNTKDPFSLSGTTDSGEQFSWSGYFRLNPLLSEGQLSLTGLSLPKYAPLYQDLVRFQIKEGSLDFASAYRLALGASKEAEIKRSAAMPSHANPPREPTAHRSRTQNRTERST